MKKIYLFLFAAALISCNSDDDTNTDSSNTSDYFPLTAGATWSYGNENELGTTEDTMFEMGTQQSNGKEYTNLDAIQPSNGLMITVLADNLVRKSNGQFIINGALETPVDGFPEITIPLDDIVLFDANASANTQLSTLSNTLNENIILDTGEVLPLTINYTSTTIQDAILSSYAVGPITYEDVISSRIVLNLEIEVSIDLGGTVINIPLLASQDALVVKNYYAANTGLVFSEVTIDYQLADLGATGIELPIPTESTQVTSTSLISFNN
ncbi:hypothetical protein ULMS_18900 [Patiriisocius marinistellae]|uniref:Uncharacterized protein n=1 Tax=Patiriisocius marinistellae TaxID=2494560 RepID=A0A5J4FYU8_9FLAO|nr:hypothetical protein [Patiriisocius marinistellae]GEQ86382.1 hypothetical protein ULMS_18900 [Patiriisocius marinistellae]